MLVAYWDAIEPEPDHDMEHTGNVVQYADGLKVDLRLWPVALLRRIAYAPAMPDELDAGYIVLLDKDRLTDDLDPPTFEAYVPGRPDKGAYLMWVDDFFSDAPYVAKCLWRDEFFPAKWCLDYDLKQIYLRRNAGVKDGVEDGAQPRLVGADGLGREGAEETAPAGGLEGA